VSPRPLDRDQKRFVELGQELYGAEGWQREFARATGLSHQLVSKIAAGDRAVTEAVRQRVILGLHEEVKRLRHRTTGVIAALQDYTIE
jgi:DNA-binding LacI/PurR family transcriptional regulator